MTKNIKSDLIRLVNFQKNTSTERREVKPVTFERQVRIHWINKWKRAFTLLLRSSSQQVVESALDGPHPTTRPWGKRTTRVKSALITKLQFEFFLEISTRTRYFFENKKISRLKGRPTKNLARWTNFNEYFATELMNCSWTCRNETKDV